MYSYYILFLFSLFSLLLSPTIGNPLASPQTDIGGNVLTPSETATLEAEIAKLKGITRISQLPPDTIYPFTQQFFNETSGQVETIELRPTARELLAGFNNPSKTNKRGEPEFGPICETSTGSPTAYDVIKAMVNMNTAEREICCQLTLGGSRCHTLEKSGTGAVGICGPWLRCCPCLHTVDFLLIMVDRCQFKFPDGRILVGGKFKLGEFGMAPPYGGYLLAFHT